MANKRFSERQMNHLLELHGSDLKVAKFLGVTRQSVAEMRSGHGIPPISKKKKKQRNSDIIHYRKQNYTVKEIANTMRLSTAHVYNILRQGKKNEKERKDWNR